MNIPQKSSLTTDFTRHYPLTPHSKSKCGLPSTTSWVSNLPLPLGPVKDVVNRGDFPQLWFSLYGQETPPPQPRQVEWDTAATVQRSKVTEAPRDLIGTCPDPSGRCQNSQQHGIQGSREATRIFSGVEMLWKACLSHGAFSPTRSPCVRVVALDIDGIFIL